MSPRRSPGSARQYGKKIPAVQVYFHSWKVRIGYKYDDTRSRGAAKAKTLRGGNLPKPPTDGSMPLFNVSPLRVRPAVASASAGVESHNRVFLHRYLDVEKKAPKKSSLSRFVALKFRPVLRGLRHTHRLFAGFGKTLVHLKQVDEQQSEVSKFELSEERTFEVNGKEIDTPGTWYVMDYFEGDGMGGGSQGDNLYDLEAAEKDEEEGNGCEPWEDYGPGIFTSRPFTAGNVWGSFSGRGDPASWFHYGVGKFPGPR